VFRTPVCKVQYSSVYVLWTRLQATSQHYLQCRYVRNSLIYGGIESSLWKWSASCKIDRRTWTEAALSCSKRWYLTSVEKMVAKITWCHNLATCFLLFAFFALMLVIEYQKQMYHSTNWQRFLGAYWYHWWTFQMTICVTRYLTPHYCDEFIWLFIQCGVPREEQALTGAAEGTKVWDWGTEGRGETVSVGRNSRSERSSGQRQICNYRPGLLQTHLFLF